MSLGTLTEALQETLSVFDVSGPPLTTTEAATRLDLGRRSTYDRLERLVDEGRLRTKKVGASGRVWWRPPPQDRAVSSGAPSSQSSRAGSGDLTGRREDEPAVRRERGLLDSVLETCSAGVGIFDRDGQPIRVNGQFTELLGFGDAVPEAYELGEQPLLDADGEPIPPAERPAMRALATGEAVVDQHVRVDGQDGRTRWLSVNAEPLDGEGVVVTGMDVTRVEEQNRRLERQRDGLRQELDEVVDRVTDGVYALDEEWRFTYVNERAETLLGRTEGEVLGVSVWEEFPESVETNWWSGFHEAMETQEPVQFEAPYEPDDEWFAVSVYPSETGISVYFRDVTERKEREDELERYVGVVEAVDEPAYELDEHGRITFVNEAFVEVMGYEESELLGEHVSIGMEDEAIDRARSKIAALSEDGAEGTTTLEYDVVTKDGERVPVENRISILTDDDGRIRGSAGVLWDVTDRQNRERELAESERRYRTLVDNFPNGAVGLFDEDLRYTLIGGETLDALDGVPEEYVGQPLRDTVPETLADELEPRYRAVFDGESSNFDVEFAGEVRHFRIIPVRDEDGTVVAGMGMSQNVTERREREREIERHREHLAALDNVNDVVRGIVEAVVDQSTREAIVTTVCGQLADADSYAAAWFGEVEPGSEAVTIQTGVGIGEAQEGMAISTAADDGPGGGPMVEAVLNQEPRALQDADGVPPWPDEGGDPELRSAAAIPVEHEGSLYGVLTVYSERPWAFQGKELEVVAQIGEVVGHAIAAVDRKHALMSDDVVELEFKVPEVFDAVGVDAPTDGTISLEYAVNVGDDEYLVYGNATSDAVAAVEALCDSRPHWREVTFRETNGEAVDFEVLFSEPPVLSRVAALGGSVEQALIEGGDFHLTVTLSPGADVRPVIDGVRDAYPAPELLRRRQRTRREDSTRRLPSVLAEEFTDRQRAALAAAYHAGFFEWPRESTGEDVARALSVSPPTFHQHLRKAERKLVASLF